MLLLQFSRAIVFVHIVATLLFKHFLLFLILHSCPLGLHNYLNLDSSPSLERKTQETFIHLFAWAWA